MNEFGQQKTDNDQFAEYIKNSFAEIGVAPQYITPAWKACQYVWDTAYTAGVQAERERCARIAEKKIYDMGRPGILQCLQGHCRSDKGQIND